MRRRRLPRFAIRTRIAAGSLLVAILLAVPAGFILDAQIRQIVRGGTAAVLRSDQAPYLATIADGRSSSLGVPGPGQRIAVVSPTLSLAVDTLPSAVRARLTTLMQDDDVHVVRAGGTTYLVRATAVRDAAGLWRVVAVREVSAEEATIGPMRRLLVIVLVTLVLGVGLAAWLLARLSLRPVARLQSTAARLSTHGGKELLPVGAIDDEISRLAGTLNALIEQLRAAAERERRLVSDASHELRTPLAVIRTQLELARAGGGDAESLLRDIAGAELGAVRLQRLLSSLLELSSIESGEHQSTASLRSAEEEVRDAIDRASFGGGSAELTLRVERDPTLGDAGTVQIAAEDLGRVVDNLVSNSLAALGGKAGRVEVILSVDPVRLRLEVSDDAGGLDEDMVAMATRRFTRGRSATRGDGAGLGLAIVEALVRGSAGELELRNRPGEGLTVIIELPVFG